MDECWRRRGWPPGRQAGTTRRRSMFESVGLAMHDGAEAFLQEFGGATVNVGRPPCSRPSRKRHPPPSWS
ncbi:hypothetical protein ACWFRX_10915 [Streptomyces sp. NPDC055100]|uniref:hypothetical protein n=1 Tax=Streptomyces sp. NPDC127532 TaxID=3345399 RepID=UPI0036414A69